MQTKELSKKLESKSLLEDSYDLIKDYVQETQDNIISTIRAPYYAFSLAVSMEINRLFWNKYLIK